MKLNFGKRLVLFLHWLFSLAACAIAVTYCVAPDCMWDIFSAVYDKIGKRQTDIIGASCLAFYIILSVASVIIILSNREKREERSFIVVESTETGKTRIAVGAVEQMIRQATNGIADISTMKTSIQNMGDSINIDADVVITDNAHLPSVTSTIQHCVRSYIEKNCGVTVREIIVNVRAVDQGNEKGRRGQKRSIDPTPVYKAPTPVEPSVPEIVPETKHTDVAAEIFDEYADNDFTEAAKTEDDFVAEEPETSENENTTTIE